MARPLFDSPYIFGMHDPGGEHHMIQMGKPGWIVFTEAVGSDPNDPSGKDFTPWSSQGLGILCRINNGYEPAGTIPHSSRYEEFAQRCANYVAASRGCKLWIIGNEMNHPVERPGVQIDWMRSATEADDSSRGRAVPWRFNALQGDVSAQGMGIVNPGEVITPQLYARCYRLCRDAIKRVPGHADDQVLVGATAPWNNLTTYDGNPTGDWVQYHADILQLLGAQNCDGITIHTYTHSPAPSEIYTDQYMNPPFQNRQYNFRAYQDFMNAIPASMRHLPVYCTETDQDVPWLNQNNGWVQRAYGEIDWWNKQPGKQQIRALVLYRWPPLDRWVIEGRAGVIEGWREAMHNNYQWSETPAPLPPPAFETGQTIYVASPANMRRTPGYTGKPTNDVLITLPADTACTVLAGPELADNLDWWQVHSTVSEQSYTGWVARTAPNGTVLLTAEEPVRAVEPPPTPPPPSAIQVGQPAVAQSPLNLRRTPGVTNKPANDVMYVVPAQGVLDVLGGPEQADSMTWWRVRYTSRFGNPFIGWAAEKTPQGTVLMAPASAPPAPVEPPPTPTPPPEFSVGGAAQTAAVVNLRRTPGFQNKPANDVIYQLPAGSDLTILDGPQPADGLTWWKVRFVSQFGNTFEGWAAATTSSGEPLLIPVGTRAGTEPPPAPTPVGKFQIGQRVYSSTILNLRRSPGYVNKPASDVLAEAPFAAGLTILDEPQTADDLTWWQVRYIDGAGRKTDGWAAEASSQGVEYLLAAPPPTPVSPVPKQTFTVGNRVINAFTGPVNLRRSPGHVGKDSSDIVTTLPPDAALTITEGPRALDDLTWWRVAGTVDNAAVDGWVAEVGPRGQRFLIPEQFKGKIRLGKPFEGNWRVTQLFADRPDFYRRFSYDGVPLRGHNGVDFGTPNGTPLLATDDGVVAQVGFELNGFGHFVKLSHEWGESIYAHMDRVNVKEGDRVKRGDRLGPADNTGNSSGPHLHFGVRIFPNKRGDGWGGYHDPAPFMNPADLVIPDSVRSAEAELPPPGMAPDAPGYVRP